MTTNKHKIMRKLILCLGLALALGSNLTNAQDIFKKHGFDKEPLTLSNGRYNEFFNNEEIVQIGTVLLNTKSNQLIAFVEEDTAKESYLAELSSRWLSIDPLAAKYPQVSPYVYANNNPIFFVDPDGRENIPALIWAAKNMANAGIGNAGYLDSYFGGSSNRWTYKIGTVPDKTVCYESCFIAYMNSGESVLPTLRTGFTNKNNAFFGRSTTTGGMEWFKSGDGTDRTFVKDIKNGELGDIVFMGEPKDMGGHAVLLAGDITLGSIEIDGKSFETASFYTLSTSSETDQNNFGGRSFTFVKQADGTWKQQGGAGYTFNGYGQMSNVSATDAQKQEATKLIDEVKKGN